MRAARFFAMMILLATAPSTVSAQGPFKAAPLNDAPPASLSAAIRSELSPQGYRVLNGQGKTYADFWLRKAIPASAKPAGPADTILFPVLREGVLLGAVRYSADGQDYRDQTIVPGVYTMRYGLQPQNGAHLGASPYRDFVLLLPGAKDANAADLAKKPLDESSAEAAGTAHPAILMMLASTDPAKPGAPAIVVDDEKQTSAVVITLPLAVKGESGAKLDVQLIVSGAAMP